MYDSESSKLIDARPAVTHTSAVPQSHVMSMSSTSPVPEKDSKLDDVFYTQQLKTST